MEKKGSEADGSLSSLLTMDSSALKDSGAGIFTSVLQAHEKESANPRTKHGISEFLSQEGTEDGKSIQQNEPISYYSSSAQINPKDKVKKDGKDEGAPGWWQGSQYY